MTQDVSKLSDIALEQRLSELTQELAAVILEQAMRAAGYSPTQPTGWASRATHVRFYEH